MDFNAQDLMEIVNNNEMLVIPQLYFDITEDLLAALILSNLAMWQKAHIQKLLSNGTKITEKNCGIYKFIEPCGDYLYREGDSFVETYKTSKHIISKALSLLKDKGLIKTYKNGNLIFYSVNTSKIKEFSADFAKKSLTSQSKKNDLVSEKNNFAKSKFLTSQSENFNAYTYTDKKTENQTENTQISFSAGENSQFANSVNSQNIKTENEKAVDNYLYGNRWDNRWLLPRDKPSFISDEVWADYCAFKRERGQKVVKTELKLFLAQLEKAYNLGVDVNARIIECISKGYASPVLEPRANETNAKSKAEGVKKSRQVLREWAAKKMAAENEIIDGEVIDDTTRIQCGF